MAGARGAVLPLAWQFSYDGVNAVDSGATKPILKISGPSGNFTADPDLSPGGSEWQYFSIAGVRPAFTWQYNWQLKIPGTNTPLAPGLYLVKIEVPATNQTDDPGGLGAVATIYVNVTP